MKRRAPESEILIQAREMLVPILADLYAKGKTDPAAKLLWAKVHPIEVELTRAIGRMNRG